MTSNWTVKLLYGERAELLRVLDRAEDKVREVYYDGKLWWWPAGCRESARALSHEISALSGEVSGPRWVNSGS